MSPAARSLVFPLQMPTLQTPLLAQIAAPSPIEQRWSSGSSSAMSPAAGGPQSVHCWVGVIMYLPDDPQQRAAVTDA